MAKHRVERFEVSKVKSGKGKHAFKVMVHNHPKPAKEGKGMKHAFPQYQKPEEHMHPNRASLNRHMSQLTNDMSVSPEGDDDGDEMMPDAAGPQEPVDAS